MSQEIAQAVNFCLFNLFRYLENVRQVVSYPAWLTSTMKQRLCDPAIGRFCQDPQAWTFETLGMMTELVELEKVRPNMALDLKLAFGHFLALDKILREGHVGMSIKEESVVALERLQAGINDYNKDVLEQRAIFFAPLPSGNWLIQRHDMTGKTLSLSVYYTGHGLQLKVNT